MSSETLYLFLHLNNSEIAKIKQRVIRAAQHFAKYRGTTFQDGKESKNYIRLETGEHSIQAEITRSDGNKEYIMQYITIQ